MSERVQLSRRRGYRKPEGAVVVARPSRWGNPFRVVNGTVFGIAWAELRDYPVGTRFPKRDEYAAYASHSDRAAATAHAVDLFRTYVTVTRRDFPEAFEAWIAPLRGHDLACWCPSGTPCHADVLFDRLERDLLGTRQSKLGEPLTKPHREQARVTVRILRDGSIATVHNTEILRSY